jgi:hypothetical protein
MKAICCGTVSAHAAMRYVEIIERLAGGSRYEDRIWPPRREAGHRKRSPRPRKKCGLDHGT